MAWQKNKIILSCVTEVTLEDGTKKKVYHRYLTKKSKGKGKPTRKLNLKKFNPHTNKRESYEEVKYK